MTRRKNLNLSKSTLIRSLQCPKSLYLYKYHYGERDPVSREQQAKFDRGHAFGARAQDLFPGGKDVSPPSPRYFMKSVEATRHLVETGFPVIYEAAFRLKTTLVYLDILVRENGRWYGYEVKSSRGISETYIRDAAIQYYVITECGLTLEDMSIIHVRPDYDENIHHSAEEVFVEVSVLGRVREMTDFVKETIDSALDTLRRDEIPDICMGGHCDIPYPCDFKGFCSRQEAGGA